MGFFQRMLGLKEKEAELAPKVGALTVHDDAQQPISDAWRYQQILAQIDSIISPLVVGNNFLEMFRNIPEVFWPIDFIAKRIAEAHYDLKRVKDDSIVWCNHMNADAVLKCPNPLMSWRDMAYTHFVYKLGLGNAFFRAALPDSITADAAIFRWCSNYWELPAHLVQVTPASNNVPIFGIASKEDLIKGYVLNYGEYSALNIPSNQIWHDRDGIPELINGVTFMKAQSRLTSVRKPIANLLAVYEARNVIYVKRGALGFIVSRKTDVTGTTALEPDEKAALREEVNKTYGLGEGQSPYGVTDVPVDFVRTNLSISDLQPFEETLEDAIKIAAVFGIPAVLVPRKDQSTFNNQDAAEKSVYTSTIIPMAKRFCEDLSAFLGLEKKGFYIDCDFSHVACLQTGLKDGEEVMKLVNERCLMEFNNGLISVNDWRSAIHESALEGDVFAKTKFEMDEQDLAFVERIIKQTTPKPANNTDKPQTNNINN